MKLVKNVFFVGVIFSILSISSCSKANVANGKIGEWVKGERLSIKVNEDAVMEVQNDSEELAPIAPMKIIGWYTKAGEKVFEIDKKRLSPQELPPKKKIFIELNQLLGGRGDILEEVHIFLGPRGEREIFKIIR